MLFSYKFFTFSQLPKNFYLRKSTTTHTLAFTENPPLSTQNPPPHNTKTTKTPDPHHHNNNKKIRDQRKQKLDIKISRRLGLGQREKVR